MKKCLLTSAGFENPAVKEAFLDLVGKEPSQIKALWVPTAAIDEQARAVLAKCMKDLFDAGLQAENIMVYHLEEQMPLANAFGACGLPPRSGSLRKRAACMSASARGASWRRRTCAPG